MTIKRNVKEHVMVFPVKILEGLGNFQGLNFNHQKYMDNILINYRYLERELAENDPRYKQVIPYVMLHYKGEIFSYCRGKLLMEKRLTGNYSIGIGGHISTEDENLFDSPYKEALDREIKEEIYINTDYSESLVAVLNDDSDEVGRVHFGIVYCFDLQSPQVANREKSIKEAGFVNISQLKKTIDKYEGWSRICIRNIHHLLEASKK